MRRFWFPVLFSSPKRTSRAFAWSLGLFLVWLSISGTAASQESETLSPGSGDVGVQPPPESTVKLKLPQKYKIDRIGDRGIGDGINLFSLKREQALGEMMSRELEAHLHLLVDPELNAYVNRVVQNLVVHSDAKVPFTVRVVKSEDVNAFSLPGGFLYVNSGLIAASPDEATFAGILAHEIAHVAARHVTKTLTRRMLFRMASMPLMFVTGGAAAAIDNVAGVAIPLSSMKFTRDSEREADLLALEYSYAAGYDPEAFVQFFETIQNRQPRQLRFMSRLFVTHPMTEDRIRRAQTAIAMMLPQKADYVIDTSDFRQVKARLFELTDQPCRDGGGRPVLLGAARRCPDATSSDGRPKLRRRIDK